MSKIKDKVFIWEIIISGVDRYGKSIIGGKAGITQDALNAVDKKFSINEQEFKMLWDKIMRKSEEEI